MRKVCTECFSEYEAHPKDGRSIRCPACREVKKRQIQARKDEEVRESLRIKAQGIGQRLSLAGDGKPSTPLPTARLHFGRSR